MDKTDKPLVDPIPSRLYKYRCWTDKYHRRMLTHNAVFFTSAKNFNDPFDCTIPTAPGPVSDEFAEKRIRFFVRRENPHLPQDQLEKVINEWKAKASWKDPQNIVRVGEMDQDRKYAQGIFALSASKGNIVLWAHYADSHHGLCVGFDASSLDAFFKKLFDNDELLIHWLKVRYAENYPTYPFFDMSPEDWFYEPIATKSNVWKYEDEYRFVLMDKTNIQFAVDNGIIVEVIFGCEMPDEHKSEIKDVLREKGSKVELFEARMKEKSFGLDFIRIDY